MALHEILYVCIPLIDSEPIQVAHVAKDIDLIHSRDPTHIIRPFTNATRLINVGNVVLCNMREFYELLYTRAPL